MARHISEQTKASVRRYYETHKAAIREYKRTWAAQNADRLTEQRRAYAAQNKETIRAKRRAEYLAHRDAILAQQKTYRSDPEAKLRKRAADRHYQQNNKDRLREQNRLHYLQTRAPNVRPKLYERQTAIDHGADHYFTGRPCSKGHISERSVSSRSCLRCNAEKMSRLYRANPEQHRARVRNSYQMHRNQRLAKATAYRLAHPEEVRGARRKWYVENRDYVLAYAKEYAAKNRTAIKTRETSRRQNNPEKIRASRVRSRAKHHETIKQYEAAYRKANRARINAYMANKVKTLADGYVRTTLIQGSPLLRKAHIPQELIKLKRVQLQIKRKLKELK